MKFILFFSTLLMCPSCAFKPSAFTSTSVPSAPDYSLSSSWAALPEIEDMADKVPNNSLKDNQSTAQVDVFFLHPTTFTGKANNWNASLGDAKLNEKTDQTTILYQASIFNGAGKVYAPRYRQGHLASFYSEDKTSSKAALDVAYEDLKTAFEYYLKHYNNNRPIIIAAHSQGALHAKKLLQDFFDGMALQRRLVAAYVVGWPIVDNDFKNIPPCKTPDQTGCVCSWRTFKYGYIPPTYLVGDSIVVTNPLSWMTGEELVPKENHKGAVLKNFNKIFPQILDAQVSNGILWAHKPKFPGSFLFNRKNYHIADFNFYYLDVRENAQRRVAAFWK
ncbi:MAG: DUF3089 domain-containing protein [Saprospiraceae bacterium]